MRKLRALYYPYTHYIDLTGLKKLVLIFDELVFVNSSRATEELPSYLIDPEIIANTQFLREEGIFQNYYYSPMKQYSQQFIQELIRQDAADESVRALCKNKTFGLASATNPELLEDKKATCVLHGPEGLFILRGATDENTIDASSRDVTNAVQIASIALTQALAISDEESLPFVTESPLFAALLRARYMRSVANLKNLYADLRPEYLTMDLSKLSTIGVAIIDAIIPNEAFESRSIEDILKYKQENQDKLERFKTTLFSFMHELEDQPWTPMLNKKVLKIIDQSVIPEARKLKDQMSRAYEKMFGSLLCKVAAAVSPTLVATIYAGLASGEILTFSCAAIAAGTGITLPEIIEVWKTRKNLNRSSLAYCVGFDRKQLKRKV